MVLVNGFSKWFFILVSNLVLVKVLVNGFLEKTVMCLAHGRDILYHTMDGPDGI